MKCQFCDNPASVHLTDIVQGKKREMHLCEGCAREHNLIPDDDPPQIDLKALLHLLAATPAAGAAGGKADPAALTCGACGLKYGEFRAEGRLGCPHDYETFRPLLEPLLERIHRAGRHGGKAPKAALRRRAAGGADDLTSQLKAAVAAERYEEAARLRDRIRQKEATDEPG